MSEDQDTTRDTVARLLRGSPAFRRRFVEAALSDDPPEWADGSLLTPAFRRWFVAQLDRELAEGVGVSDPDEIVRRADVITRLKIRWRVVDPEERRLANEFLAAMIDRARTGDNYRPPLDASVDPQTADQATAVAWVLWLADVDCHRCGKTVAKATLGDDFGLILKEGTPTFLDPKAVEFYPEPNRVAGSLIWPCRRCRCDVQVNAADAFRIIRQRWLKRNETLDRDTPMTHTILKARPVTTQA